MTNEQLAEFIQQGGADDLKPVLWDRVKHLCYKIAGDYYSQYSERFNACGAELSDVRQECYPAFLNAIDGFKPAESFLFVSYLAYPIKNACARLLGILNHKRQNNKPLDNCISLDAPLDTEDGSEITLCSLIEDKTASQAYENALERISDEETRKVLNAALDRLDKPLRDVIVLHYFENMTQTEIAKQVGVSAECISRRKDQALKKLRCMPDVRMLRAEQKIENCLHFDSRANGEAYLIAQRKIHDIFKRGSYLSYGQRQAIIEDCRLQSALENSVEYKAYMALSNCDDDENAL